MEIDETANNWICQSCGKKNSLKAEYCIECGKKIQKVKLPFADILPKDDIDYETDKDMDKVPLYPFAHIKMEPVKISETKKTSKNQLSQVKKVPQQKIKSDNIHPKKSQLDEDLNKKDSLSNLIPFNPLDEIKKANEMLKTGLITEEEFEIIKTKYLKKI